MSYNPSNNKPYVIFDNLEQQDIFNANTNTGTDITFNAYSPTTLNIPIKVNNNKGNGIFNNETSSFSFENSTFLLGDILIWSNWTRASENFNITTNFLNEQGDEIGVRGQETSRDIGSTIDRNDYSNHPENITTQISGELPRVVNSANKNIKFNLSHWQSYLEITATNYPTVYNDLRICIPVNSGTVFGFVI